MASFMRGLLDGVPGKRAASRASCRGLRRTGWEARALVRGPVEMKRRSGDESGGS